MSYAIKSLLLSMTLTCLILFSTLCPNRAEGDEQRGIPAEVQEQLDAHVKQFIDAYEARYCNDAPPGNRCRGTEYKDMRKFCFGDIDGDGRDDIAVLYTIEGFCCGNNYYFFMAVLLDRGSRFELTASTHVGGKGERGINFNAIREKKILLNTKEYLPDDAMCCPRGKGKTTYRLKKGRLVESERLWRKSKIIQPVIDELLKKYNEKAKEAK